MSAPTKHDVFEATATNGFFIVTGLAMYSNSLLLVAPALWAVLLGFGSGTHHLNIGKRFMEIETSRMLDYMPMYGILLSLMLLGTGVTGVANFAISLFGAALLILAANSSRVAIGVLISIVLIQLIWVAGFPALMQTVPMLAIAWGFNYLGDSLPERYHSMVHGIWHLVVCAPLYKVALIFLEALL